MVKTYLRYVHEEAFGLVASPRAPTVTDGTGKFAYAPGIHEVLRRQGLLAGTWCLDVHEQLSAGQGRDLDRVARAYPGLADDAFVKANLARWLAD